MFILLKKYLRINKLERKNFNQLFYWLVCSYILVRFLPLKWFQGILGEFKKETETAINKDQEEIVNLTINNLRRCKKIIPWKVKCFEEAIAVKKVLGGKNIESTIFLGVDRNHEKKLIAHAWLKTGNKIITGSKGHKKYAVVGFYG